MRMEITIAEEVACDRARKDEFIQKQFTRLYDGDVSAVQIATTHMAFVRLYHKHYPDIFTFWFESQLHKDFEAHVDEVLGRDRQHVNNKIQDVLYGKKKITDAVPDWAEAVEAYPKESEDVNE
jgi:hypothetical protein|tara:strand:+ start:4592 stop:4960 length:369 start_codon:yes stop_codon:yes gene_type:complete